MVAIDGIPGLHVSLSRESDGSVVIGGQHLRGDSEYEYWITIAAIDVGAFAAALGVAPDDIEHAWSAQVQAIAREGETTWLRRRGVPCELSTWGHVGL